MKNSVLERMALTDFFPMTSAMRAEQERALGWLERIVDKGYRDIVIAAPTGCHGRGQKVMLYSGRSIAVEDVRVGDLLMGPDSMPRKVLELIRGTGRMYFCQSDIGAAFTANDQHVLSLNRRSAFRYSREGRWHKHGTREVTLAEYLKADDGFKARFKLWRAIKPIQFPERQCQEYGPDEAYTVAYAAGQSGTALVRPFLVTSVENRLELLAGYMDALGRISADPTGYHERGAVVCYADNDEVLSCIAWLLASFGWGCHRGFLDNRFGLVVNSALESVPLRVLALPITSSKRRAAHRGRCDAVYTGDDRFFGFKLEGDGLYLTDDFVVHHNSGKTAMGIAFANWLAVSNPVPQMRAEIEAEEKRLREWDEACERNPDAEEPPGGIAPGAYYLCTQKLLQDQITDDVAKLKAGLNKVVTLKTAGEYECSKYGNCAVGAICKKKGKCPRNACTYKLQQARFLGAHVGVTNYPYLMTERAYSGAFPKRRGLVCDEAHNVATSILRFVELSANQKLLDELTPGETLPERIANLSEFMDWVGNDYVPALQEHLAIAADLAENGTDEQAQIAAKIEQYLKKTQGALAACGTRAEWVFWDVRENGKLEYIARPVEAAPFAEDTLLGAGQVRLYLSAYPGVKSVFARDLGLHEEEVAWASLKSTFPPERRKVVLMPVVALSKDQRKGNIPVMMRMLEKIFEKHSKHKGLIHAHSYEFGEAVFRHFQGTPHGSRLLFPRSAEERDICYAMHRDSEDPTIILTPSMTEGYDFAGPLARWQVILKCPFASLGDKQTKARMEKDQDWYDLCTVSTIIQAAGRGMRFEDDFCVTYSFDSDVLALYNKRRSFFPKWFQDAVVIRE